MSNLTVKTYSKKNRNDSQSTKAVNALFAVNIGKRNISQQNARRKKLKINNLPPRYGNCFLSDDSIHVNKELENTFDRVCKGEVYAPVNFVSRISAAKYQSDSASTSKSVNTNISISNENHSPCLVTCKDENCTSKITELKTDVQATSGQHESSNLFLDNSHCTGISDLSKEQTQEDHKMVTFAPVTSSTFCEKPTNTFKRPSIKFAASSTPIKPVKKNAPNFISPIMKFVQKIPPDILQKSYEEIKQWDITFPDISLIENGNKTESCKSIKDDIYSCDSKIKTLDPDNDWKLKADVKVVVDQYLDVLGVDNAISVSVPKETDKRLSSFNNSNSYYTYNDLRRRRSESIRNLSLGNITAHYSDHQYSMQKSIFYTKTVNFNRPQSECQNISVKHTQNESSDSEPPYFIYSRKRNQINRRSKGVKGKRKRRTIVTDSDSDSDYVYNRFNKKNTMPCQYKTRKTIRDSMVQKEAVDNDNLPNKYSYIELIKKRTAKKSTLKKNLFSSNGALQVSDTLKDHPATHANTTVNNIVFINNGTSKNPSSSFESFSTNNIKEQKVSNKNDVKNKKGSSLADSTIEGSSLYQLSNSNNIKEQKASHQNDAKNKNGTALIDSTTDVSVFVDSSNTANTSKSLDSNNKIKYRKRFRHNDAIKSKNETLPVDSTIDDSVFVDSSKITNTPKSLDIYNKINYRKRFRHNDAIKSKNETLPVDSTIDDSVFVDSSKITNTPKSLVSYNKIKYRKRFRLNDAIKSKNETLHVDSTIDDSVFVDSSKITNTSKLLDTYNKIKYRKRSRHSEAIKSKNETLPVGTSIVDSFVIDSSIITNTLNSPKSNNSKDTTKTSEPPSNNKVKEQTVSLQNGVKNKDETVSISSTVTEGKDINKSNTKEVKFRTSIKIKKQDIFQQSDDAKQEIEKTVPVNAISEDSDIIFVDSFNYSLNLGSFQIQSDGIQNNVKLLFAPKPKASEKIIESIVDLTKDDDEIFKEPKRCTLKPGKLWRRSLLSLKKLESPSVINGDCRSPITKLNQSRTRIEPLEKDKSMLLDISELENYATFLGYVSEQEDKDKSDLEKTIDQYTTALRNYYISKFNVRPIAARDIVLQKCGQTEVLPFETCYPNKNLRNCHKIGEGVYGEVFLYKSPIGETSVLKIIPIEGDLIVNGERQKSFDEVLSEIVILKELSGLRKNRLNETSGFSEVKQIRCVKGKYPERLLELWELYDETQQSENDSPEMFNDEQLFIILELQNGGQDLEKFTFNSALQAFSVLKQITYALAVAEIALQFEHRDLHWGNILITKCDKKKRISYTLNGQKFSIASEGVEAIIIDFTLSRITCDDVVIYNNLSSDKDLFTADGDYQFEIYRLMKAENKNDWKRFTPYTNVLWLHYVIDKMIEKVHYRFPKSRSHKFNIEQLMEIKDEIPKYGTADLMATKLFRLV